MSGGLAIWGCLHSHPAFDELVSFEGVEDGSQLLPIKLQQFQHVLLFDTGVANQNVQGQRMFGPVETTHHILGKTLQSSWDFGENLWVCHIKRPEARREGKEAVNRMPWFKKSTGAQERVCKAF